MNGRVQQMIGELIDESSVALRDRIEMHDRRKGEIFAVNGIEAELERALQRKVWLKSGGYLVIDAREVLINPFAWDALKRCIRSGEIKIEDALEQYRLRAGKDLGG